MKNPLPPPDTVQAKRFVPYHQPLIRWVPSPSVTLSAPDKDIKAVFAKFVGQNLGDIFDAYAFDGPRIQQPFRPLHKIGEPRLDDISVWAENLRFAREQRLTFGNEHNEGWNEGPEDMEKLSEARILQNWVSVEWLTVYGENEFVTIGSEKWRKKPRR